MFPTCREQGGQPEDFTSALRMEGVSTIDASPRYGERQVDEDCRRADGCHAHAHVNGAPLRVGAQAAHDANSTKQEEKRSSKGRAREPKIEERKKRAEKILPNEPLHARGRSAESFNEHLRHNTPADDIESD